MMINKKSKG